MHLLDLQTSQLADFGEFPFVNLFDSKGIKRQQYELSAQILYQEDVDDLIQAAHAKVVHRTSDQLLGGIEEGVYKEFGASNGQKAALDIDESSEKPLKSLKQDISDSFQFGECSGRLLEQSVLDEMVFPCNATRASAEGEEETLSDEEESTLGTATCVHASFILYVALTIEQLVEQMITRTCSSAACSSTSNLCFCLTCYKWLCCDGNIGHKSEHYQQTGHSVFFSVQEEQPWCEACKRSIDIRDQGDQMRDLLRKLITAKRAERVWFTDCNPDRCNAANGEEKRQDGFCNPQKDSGQSKNLVITSECANREDVSKIRCNHVKSVRTTFSKIPASLKIICQYTQCPFNSDLAICLSCYKIFCGQAGDQHMGLHLLKNEDHAVCMYFNDLSFWCQRCDQRLDGSSHKTLRKIRERFIALAFDVEPKRSMSRGDVSKEDADNMHSN